MEGLISNYLADINNPLPTTKDLQTALGIESTKSITEIIVEYYYKCNNHETRKHLMEFLNSFCWDLVDHIFSSLKSESSSHLDESFRILSQAIPSREWQILIFEKIHMTKTTEEFRLLAYALQLLVISPKTIAKKYEDRLQLCFYMFYKRLNQILDEGSQYSTSQDKSEYFFIALAFSRGCIQRSEVWMSTYSENIGISYENDLSDCEAEIHLRYLSSLCKVVTTHDDGVAFNCLSSLVSSVIGHDLLRVALLIDRFRYAALRYSMRTNQYKSEKSVLTSKATEEVVDKYITEYCDSTKIELLELLPMTALDDKTVKKTSKDILSSSFSSEESENEDDEDFTLHWTSSGISIILLGFISSILVVEEEGFGSLKLPQVFSREYLGELYFSVLPIIAQNPNALIVSKILDILAKLYPSRGKSDELKQVHNRSKYFVSTYHEVQVSEIIHFYSSGIVPCSLLTAASQSIDCWSYFQFLLESLSNCRDEQRRKFAYFAIKVHLSEYETRSRFALLHRLVTSCPYPHIQALLMDTVKDFCQVAATFSTGTGECATVNAALVEDNSPLHQYLSILSPYSSTSNADAADLSRCVVSKLESYCESGNIAKGQLFRRYSQANEYLGLQAYNTSIPNPFWSPLLLTHFIWPFLETFSCSAATTEQLLENLDSLNSRVSLISFIVGRFTAMKTISFFFSVGDSATAADPRDALLMFDLLVAMKGYAGHVQASMRKCDRSSIDYLHLELLLSSIFLSIEKLLTLCADYALEYWKGKQ